MGKSTIKASTIKLDDAVAEALLEAINKNNFEEFKDHLTDIEPNYKSINALRKIIKSINKRRAKKWALKLVESDNVVHKVCAAIVFKQQKYFRKNLQFIKDLILEFSEHENWNIRQMSVDLFEQLIKAEIEDWIEFFRECVNSENSSHRRLALLTAKEIARSATYEDELKTFLLDEIEQLIFDKDPYVITVITEVFGEGFMRKVPDVTFTWIEEKIDSIDDPFAQSVLLNVLASRHAREDVDRSLDIINSLLSIENKKVKKARSAALRNLAKTSPDRVSSFLESRLNNKQAVDHWAELEADGTLNVFEF